MQARCIYHLRSAFESGDHSCKVTIHNFAFGPTTIIVKEGTIVAWTNSDSLYHTEIDGMAIVTDA
jgi:plastocyanin